MFYLSKELGKHGSGESRGKHDREGENEHN